MTDALHVFADLPLWVTWRSEERGGKPTKVPWSPTINCRASPTDPLTWATRAVVEHAAQQEGHDGIGIVLARIDEGRHLGGVDLDSCLDDDGNLAPWAREIVELLNSYTEVSPSGHGLKLFFTHDECVTLAEGMRWRSAVRRPALNDGKEPGIEFNLDRRYFTVTDQTFESFDAVRQIYSDTLRAVQAMMEAFADKPRAPTHHPRQHDDDQQRLFDAIAHIRIGMAIFRETNGSAAGYSAFLDWSRKSSKFNSHDCDERWQHWRNSPPDRLTAGTIIYEARAGGWQDPHQTKSSGAARSLADGDNAAKPPNPNGNDEAAADQAGDGGGRGPKQADILIDLTGPVDAHVDTIDAIDADEPAAVPEPRRSDPAEPCDQA